MTAIGHGLRPRSTKDDAAGDAADRLGRSAGEARTATITPSATPSATPEPAPADVSPAGAPAQAHPDLEPLQQKSGGGDPGGDRADADARLAHAATYRHLPAPAPWRWSPHRRRGGRPHPARPVGATAIKAAVDRLVSHNGQQLIAIRRHLHANPELGGAEHQTTGLLLARLQDAGLRPVPLASGTGLTCDVGGRLPGPVIALRADLDALAVEDLKEQVPYRSRRPGVCHACGHDVHTAALLGAGLALASVADQLPGVVRLVFQPAEETANGAAEVIGDGRLDGVEAIFGLHCDPSLAVGKVATRVGPITGSADLVEVLLRGPGGHTARPHLTADLVYVVSRVVTELPAGLSRLADPRHGMSLVFGMVSSGTAANVIPNTAVARGTLRTLNRDAWELAPMLVQRLLEGVVSPYGVAHELRYRRGTPPVDNDPGATQLLRQAVTAALGSDGVAEAPQSLGGEDFAWYLERVPGSFARLGVRLPGTNLDLHAGTFDADERSIAVGIRVMAQVAVDALRHYGHLASCA